MHYKKSSIIPAFYSLGASSKSLPLTVAIKNVLRDMAKSTSVDNHFFKARVSRVRQLN